MFPFFKGEMNRKRKLFAAGPPYPPAFFTPNATARRSFSP